MANSMSKQIGKLLKENYPWRYDKDNEPDYRQYNEKDALRLYLKYEVDVQWWVYEKAITKINKCIVDDEPIPYKKIRKKYGFSKEYVDKCIDLADDFYDKYYPDGDENIDYAINNLQHQQSEVMAGIMSDLTNCMFDQMTDPTFIQGTIEKLYQETDDTDVARKMVLETVMRNPELYTQYKTVIDQYRDQMVKPFSVNVDNGPLNVQMNQIASAIINNPDLNAGIEPNQAQVNTIADDGTYSMSFNNGGNKASEPEKETNSEPLQPEQPTNDNTEAQPESVAAPAPEETKDEENKNEQQTTEDTSANKGNSKGGKKK